MAEQTIPTTTQDTAQVPSTREESRYLIPPVDIYENEDGLVVVADLPGTSREQVDVSVENSVLTITAKPSLMQRGEEVRQEFELWPYFRQFQLGEQVDQTRIEAELKHGVLTLRLPKVEEARPKQIQVKTA